MLGIACALLGAIILLAIKFAVERWWDSQDDDDDDDDSGMFQWMSA